jgi:hypothetical protein
MSSRQLEILRLYRDLIRYSQRLKYTDVDFYLTRIKQEFAKGKTLENEDEILRQISVKKTSLDFPGNFFLFILERSRILEE